LSADDTEFKPWGVALEPYGLKQLSGMPLAPQAVTAYYPVTGNKEKGVWRCPAAWFPERDVGDGRRNYDYNADGIVSPTTGPMGLGRIFRWGASGKPPEISVVKEAEVLAPSEMIAFGDAAYRVTPTRLDFGWTPLGRGPTLP
jgi:hypothetical protein